MDWSGWSGKDPSTVTVSALTISSLSGSCVVGTATAVTLSLSVTGAVGSRSSGHLSN